MQGSNKDNNSKMKVRKKAVSMIARRMMDKKKAMLLTRWTVLLKLMP